ncbi:AAA family ATPase [Candidatus Micrarchaeota archaeon]|nr:AAA family ATPase [Candidatus Micrarchaeota archaeon]
MVNPYDPQNPAKPKYFGGRENILEVVKGRIDKARLQGQSGGVLVYGYRGVGKTSLLKKIVDLAKEGGEAGNPLVIYRRLSKTTSESELYSIIIETIVEEIDQRKNAVQKLLPAKISSARVLDVEFQFDDNWKQKTPFFRWNSFVQNSKNIDFILVAIDDADYLTPEALGELKTIVESQSKNPVLLVVSGGIEFEERLVEDYSPIVRVFSGASFNLGEFELNETKEVLLKPLGESNTHWNDDAIKEVHTLSRGYPYLVQCLASASYAENSDITKSRVLNSRSAAIEIGKGWLSHELERASDNDILSFLKIAKTSKPVLKSSEIQDAGVSPPYIGRLVVLGVIKLISRGRYAVHKPPIIAYYHALKRNIPIE